jgi:hypothetical protein
VGTRFSAPVHASPGALLASYTMGTGSLSPGLKRLGRSVNNLSPSSAEVKVRVELYIYSSSGPSLPVRERTLDESIGVCNGDAACVFAVGSMQLQACSI